VIICAGSVATAGPRACEVFTLQNSAFVAGHDPGTALLALNGLRQNAGVAAGKTARAVHVAEARR